MRKNASAAVILTLILTVILTLCGCGGGVDVSPAPGSAPATQSAQPSASVSSQEEGRGDIIEEVVPEGGEAIGQGIYYYELAEFSGDYGNGLSPREGAELVNNLLIEMGLYSDNGIPASQCVYISLDELAVLDSAVGRECYIYSVGTGPPESGLNGDGYEVIYRVSVDYSGDKTAAVYEDYAIPGDGTFTLTLYGDLSGGSDVEGLIKTTELVLPLEDAPASPSLIAFALADGLTEWIGLDFTINDAIFDEDSVTIDWSADSTLIAGLDDREQNPEFYIYDAYSLNWFMMDSLMLTLKNNLDITTVYYSSGGGPVTFPNPEDMAAGGLPELPPDQPYEGSAFFKTHADARG